MTTWRVGRKVGRTIYIGDKLIGILDTAELALQAVNAVNGTLDEFADRRGRDGETDEERWAREGTER